MNELAIRSTGEVIASVSNGVYKALKNSIYPGAKDESIAMVIEYCQAKNLDPMQKPVHIVPMWIVDKKTDKGEMRDVVMPGIGLYRVQAARSGCAGISEPEFGEDVTECLGGVDITYPKWARVVVKRIIAGQICEFPAKEYWKENYATAKKDSAAPNAMWKKRPYAQLAKCAEAQALRKGFPEIGALPTAEEMEGKHIGSDEVDLITKGKAPNKGVSGLKAKLGLTQEPVGDVIDEETGEVLSDQSHDMSLETVQFLIESATTVKELLEAKEKAIALSDEDKDKVRKLYQQKEKELNK